MEAKKKNAVKLTTGNKPGTMGEVFSNFAEAGVNLTALSAWVQGDKGEFRLIADDSAKLFNVLKEAGYAPETEEVVAVKAEDKPGVAAEIGKKLGDAGVSIVKTYATCGLGGECVLILLTEDNDKAVAVLS